MNDEILVLGATGRVGRAVAARLHAAGRPVVLAGRSPEALARLAQELGGAPRVLAGTIEETLDALAADPPAVVVNTVGPFTTTALRVARACPPGTHYVDVANEYPAVEAVLGLHEEAARTDRTFVSGAGFGVTATETVLLRLIEGRPAPDRVRVDAIASVATEPGRIGSALAASILDGVAAGGSRVEGGRVTRSPLGADPLRLTTPDGDEVVTGSAPSGELLAAWRGSGADSIVAASNMVPTGRGIRALMPAVSAVLRLGPVGRFGARRLAKVKVKAAAMPRQHSWAHASAQWSSGASREAWLRAGDGMEFTASVAADVALRLVRGEGTSGAYTPGALFGPDLAVAAGGDFIADGTVAPTR